MVKKLGISPAFSSLANEHLGIIVQNLAKSRPLHTKSEKIAEISTTNAKDFFKRPASDIVENEMFNLDISKGEIVGRAVLLANEKGAEVERYWVFRTARSDEDIERNNFQLVRKLPNNVETQRFIEECYQVLFGRPADSDGLANYIRMLKSKHLSPRDFMIALLTSPEGRNHVETLVIVPYPSSHLTKRDPSGRPS